MSLDSKLVRRLQKALEVVDEHDTRGPRLINDAGRLWNRCQRFIALNLFGGQIDPDALELACHALQLPQAQAKAASGGKMGRNSLKDRVEQSAEMLVSLCDGQIDEKLLDRTTRILHELPHSAPTLNDARLLADALNLDDFGLIGLTMQMIQLARQGDGVQQLAEGSEKREQYGYWEARLKDGFHLEPVRKIAVRRLQHARQAAKMLIEELNEDRP